MLDCLHSTYGVVAAEYYDAALHPTCANFRELSAKYITERLNAVSFDGDLVEVGAGKSILAELIDSTALRKLILSDSSADMLEYSQAYARAGAKLLICDAREISRFVKNAALLVASLADPYNDARFWASARRSLASDGEVICTIPSRWWAEQFRTSTNAPLEGALFQVIDGSSHLLPSFVPQFSVQAKMLEDAGFALTHFRALCVEDLQVGSRLSSKLSPFARTKVPVLWGFSARPLRSNQGLSHVRENGLDDSNI